MKRYSGKQVGFETIKLCDGFWKEEQDLVRSVTIDAVYDRFEETGRFEALKCEWKEGMPKKPHIFWDSDITKWLEGAAYYLREERDEELEGRVDQLIDWMGNSQQEDGYLNSYFVTVEPNARFTRRTDHELYCAGHLIEGALAYYEATGKRKLLDIAIRYVDLIDRIFRVEQSAMFDTPGHEEIELALVKLYRFTGEVRYKELAEFFIDRRGCSVKDTPYEFADMKNMQSHLPVREQKTAEGHAVRALYLYCAMADLALLNQEDALAETCEKLFDNIVGKRMQITGGVGSTYLGESFTIDYDLPEYTSYNETCASIALAMFCRRMWLIDADRKYADCAERALYNTVLSGISLSGDRFFYENPIAADPDRTTFYQQRPEGIRMHMPILERVKVFDCSCCPPNLVRLMGSITDYMYSTAGDTIYAHCYMNADALITLDEQQVVLHQQTAYPYDGKIILQTETSGQYAIAVRIPAWSKTYTLTINGESDMYQEEKGYVRVCREWKAGDQIELSLNIEPELIEANPNVSNLCGRVAIERGPVVFCAEGIDNGSVSLKDVRIASDAKLAYAEELICGRILPVLQTEAWIREPFTGLYRPNQDGHERKITLTLIPYLAWANRGVSQMNVWFLKNIFEK